MIASEINESELSKYGLGGHDPPKDVVDALHELDKNLVLVWNSDQWEVYRRQNGKFYWQKSCPVKGLTITPGIKSWLQKLDSSCGGRYDVDDRKKQFLESMYAGLAHEASIQREIRSEQMREISSMSNYAERAMFGAPGISVPAGPVVGHNNGVPIRMYRRKVGGNRSS